MNVQNLVNHVKSGIQHGQLASWVTLLRQQESWLDEVLRGNV